jgi:hypothetical protein
MLTKNFHQFKQNNKNLKYLLLILHQQKEKCLLILIYIKIISRRKLKISNQEWEKPKNKNLNGLNLYMLNNLRHKKMYIVMNLVKQN